MSDKKIILPELRFKGSEESEMTLKVELAQDSRHIVEGDRTVILSQSEQYDKERQQSEKYRLTGVIRPIWNLPALIAHHRRMQAFRLSPA